MTPATELVLHRRALDLLGAWTGAGDDELRPAVVRTVSAWCGGPVTLFSGHPPTTAPRVHQPVVAGRAASMLEHYRDDGFAAADPFAAPAALRLLRDAGTVTLDELARGLRPDQRRYVEEFLHRHRIHHQLTVWIDTGRPLHAYLSVLSARPLRAEVRPTLLLLRPHLGGLLRRTQAHRTDADWSALTPRERQVADLVAAGEANRAIARRLGVAEHTVKRHLTHVYAKLHLDSRTRLAVHHPTTKVAYRVRPAGPMLEPVERSTP